MNISKRGLEKVAATMVISSVFIISGAHLVHAGGGGGGGGGDADVGTLGDDANSSGPSGTSGVGTLGDDAASAGMMDGLGGTGMSTGPADIGGNIGGFGPTGTGMTDVGSGQSRGAGGKSNGFSVSGAATGIGLGFAVGGPIGAIGGGLVGGVYGKDIGNAARGAIDSVSGLFDGPSDNGGKNDNASQNDGKANTGGNNASNGKQEGPGSGPARNNATPLPDLTMVANKAVVNGSTVTFEGTVKNASRVAARATENNAGETNIAYQILVDYSCDGNNDVQGAFQKPFAFLGAGKDRAVSFTKKNIPNGKHCFAYVADLRNKVAESNEQNNRSGWKNFTVTKSSTDAPASSGTKPAQSSPAASAPSTPAQTTSEPSTPAQTTSPQPVETKPIAVTSVTGIALEARPMNGDQIYSNTTGRTFTAAGPYQAGSLTIASDQHVALRWSAPGYSNCTASFASIGGQTSGDTESDNPTGRAIDVQEPGSGVSRTYTIACTDSSGSREEQSVVVTKQ